jgi:hypothetical protein
VKLFLSQIPPIHHATTYIIPRKLVVPWPLPIEAVYADISTAIAVISEHAKANGYLGLRV